MSKIISMLILTILKKYSNIAGIVLNLIAALCLAFSINVIEPSKEGLVVNISIAGDKLYLVVKSNFLLTTGIVLLIAGFLLQLISELIKEKQYSIVQNSTYVRSKWKGTFDTKTIMELTMLMLYWVVTSFSFIIVSSGLKKNHIESILLIIFGFLYMFMVVLWLNRRKMSVVVNIFLPVLMPFFILKKIVYLRELICVRSNIYVIVILSFISLFSFILYSEKITTLSKESARLSLVHKRYLEYERNFIWLIIIAVIAYYGWKFDADISLPATSPLSSWLIQLGSIVFAGIILVMYAFDTKLKEIEQQIVQ